MSSFSEGEKSKFAGKKEIPSEIASPTSVESKKADEKNDDDFDLFGSDVLLFVINIILNRMKMKRPLKKLKRKKLVRKRV